ncbi:MAG: hypothetical protein HZRFUVUK_001402 [Candidatus Fervidibacterota bacterium]
MQKSAKRTSSEGTFSRLFRGIATVGKRGQIILPADVRREEGISPGDKMLIFAHPAGLGVFIMPAKKLEEAWTEFRAFLQSVEGSKRR